MRELCLSVRANDGLENTPILGVVDDPWTGGVSEAFAAGVDGYCLGSQQSGLKNRLDLLLSQREAGAKSASGNVLVLDNEGLRRAPVIRSLRQMGFAVACVDSADKLDTESGSKLCVCRASLVSADLVHRLRADQPYCPYVFVGTRGELAALPEGLRSSERAHLLYDDDPAHVSFMVNHVLLGTVELQRRSRRLAYATVVVGETRLGQQVHGYSYNVSMGGLFVRMLNPPAMGTELMLEFAPPSSDKRVKLQSFVAWRQAWTGGLYGMPCGFGVQFDEAAVAACPAFCDGYHALREELDALQGFVQQGENTRENGEWL